ncbi:uncharacterized protein LOC142767425 [Rhipicephalus microplus]|uniref:uncharacterized protein LOC142767425 n=1 Tax=Rhipicephalus microplus TaxID=6941 RepID=UPI003F6CBE2A
MMSSYNQPQIFDPVVMTAISALRKAPGVHVYLDAAQLDDTTTWVYSTVIDNFEKIPSGKMTYAFLMQAIIDNPARKRSKILHPFILHDAWVFLYENSASSVTEA